MKKIGWVIFAAVLASCGSCNQNTKTEAITEKPATPDYTSLPKFNEDSCYNYVSHQCSFGPRVPNTLAAKKCGDYLIKFFKQYADTVYVQNTTVTTFDNHQLKIRNVIAAFKPKLGNRLLIASHWDSRPFADQEKDLAKMKQPILAADDGASGVAVMMELATLLKNNPPSRGIDLVLLDAEDWGCPSPDSPLSNGKYDEDSYCLGTQYWCKNPHVKGYTADNGILLDMVGARGATFTLEAQSIKYAGDFMNNVWKTAAALGYADHFVFQNSSGITDDHVYINTLLHVPTIDIIYHDLYSQTNWFAPHWHTLNDNMSIIDKTTLKAVGQTLLAVIFNNQSNG